MECTMSDEFAWLFGVFCGFVITAFASAIIAGIITEGRGASIPKYWQYDDCDVTQNVIVYDRYPPRELIGDFEENHWLCVPSTEFYDAQSNSR